MGDPQEIVALLEQDAVPDLVGGHDFVHRAADPGQPQVGFQDGRVAAREGFVAVHQGDDGRRALQFAVDRRLERHLGLVHVHRGPVGLVDDGAGLGGVLGIDDPGPAEIADLLGAVAAAVGERSSPAGMVVFFSDRRHPGRQGTDFDDEIDSANGGLLFVDDPVDADGGFAIGLLFSQQIIDQTVGLQNAIVVIGLVKLVHGDDQGPGAEVALHRAGAVQRPEEVRSQSEVLRVWFSYLSFLFAALGASAFGGL